MERTLRALMQDAFMNETALGKFRQTLDEPDQTALDEVMGVLRGYKTTAEAASQMSPMETFLLVAALRQQQKVECLEILLQNLSERVLALYGERRNGIDRIKF